MIVSINSPFLKKLKRKVEKLRQISKLRSNSRRSTSNTNFKHVNEIITDQSARSVTVVIERVAGA